MIPAPESLHESGLVLRIARRDKEAVGQLYDTLGTWVYSLVLSIVKDRSDAEEVTQEVFLQIWHEAHRYNPERGSVRAWLSIMARRKAIDRTRAKGYKESARMTDLVDALEVAESQGQQSQLRYGSDFRILRDALQRLENGQAEALSLSYYHGFSHSEIAERLNLPLGTVKTRIRSGIRQLRDLLGVQN